MPRPAWPVDGAGNAVYDPASDTWTMGSYLPTTRHELAACTVGTKAYAIGGYVDATMKPWSPEVDEFDPTTGVSGNRGIAARLDMEARSVGFFRCAVELAR